MTTPTTPTSTTKSGVRREYLRAFGPVEEYLKVLDEGRPNRWKNLARRAFLQRPILRYAESSVGGADELEGVAARTAAALDEVVDALNGIRVEFAESGDELPRKRLAELYERARALILG